MNLHEKVGHKVLTKGEIVRSPSGSSDWVVISNESDGKVIMACVSKYMTKDAEDITEWYKIK